MHKTVSLVSIKEARVPQVILWKEKGRGWPTRRERREYLVSAGKDITDANRKPRGAHMQCVVCKYTYPIFPTPYYQF